jgi:hypothetical protein
MEVAVMSDQFIAWKCHWKSLLLTALSPLAALTYFPPCVGIAVGGQAIHPRPGPSDEDFFCGRTERRLARESHPQLRGDAAIASAYTAPDCRAGCTPDEDLKLAGCGLPALVNLHHLNLVSRADRYFRHHRPTPSF